MAEVRIEDDPAFAARLRAAEALRRLGHAIVAADTDPELLDDIAATAAAWVPQLEASPRRQRPIGDMKREMFSQAASEDSDMQHFPDCFVSGKANPMGIATRMRRAGDEAIARVTLGAAFEGAPGRAHGGVVAALFDDTMGYVLAILGAPAFTGELKVRYNAPTPVGVEIEFRAWLRDRNGRRIHIDAEATHDGNKIATAEGLFIAIPMERFSEAAAGLTEPGLL